MNNRYIFRGKRKDNGEWIEGNLVYSQTTTRGVITEIYTLEMTYEVIPETVGQCTGLKYKDDKLMFEGDIARDEQSGYYYFIKWFPEYAGFALADRNGRIAFGVEELEMFLDDLVVVGNICDNSIEELRFKDED